MGSRPNRSETRDFPGFSPGIVGKSRLRLTGRSVYTTIGIIGFTEIFMRGKAIVSMIIGLTLTMLAFGADWPNFSGPTSDGSSPDTGINKDWGRKPPKELWRIALTDDGYSGPAVRDGKLYIVDHEGENDKLRVIDVATGKDLWQHEYKTTSRNNFGFTNSTPAVDDARVYLYSSEGDALAVDLATQKQLWRKNPISETGGKLPRWRNAISPVIDGDRVLFAVGGKNASIVGLDPKTGKEVFRGKGDFPIGYATPTIAEFDGKKQYLYFAQKHLVGIDAKTGAVLWKQAWETKHDVNAARPIVVDGAVFITSNYFPQTGGCALVKPAGGSAKIVWENKTLHSHFNAPVYANGLIFGVHMSLVCMDPKTGATKWSEDRFEKGGLLAIDGTIIVVDGQSGRVVMYEAAGEKKKLGEIQPLKGRHWSPPIAADKKLFVRNQKSLVCLDLAE